MSVWDSWSGGVSLPPNTPNIEIRVGATGVHRVLVDGQPAHSAPTYHECHRWAQNNYRLTSTMMLPVYDDYERSLPAEARAATSPEAPEGAPESAPPNRFRKQPSS